MSAKINGRRESEVVFVSSSDYLVFGVPENTPAQTTGNEEGDSNSQDYRPPPPPGRPPSRKKRASVIKLYDSPVIQDNYFENPDRGDNGIGIRHPTLIQLDENDEHKSPNSLTSSISSTSSTSSKNNSPAPSPTKIGWRQKLFTVSPKTKLTKQKVALESSIDYYTELLGSVMKQRQEADHELTAVCDQLRRSS